MHAFVFALGIYGGLSAAGGPAQIQNGTYVYVRSLADYAQNRTILERSYAGLGELWTLSGIAVVSNDAKFCHSCVLVCVCKLCVNCDYRPGAQS